MNAVATAIPVSFEDLVLRHRTQVYRDAYRLSGNPHDAADITQDVLIKAFGALANYQPGNFGAWLRRITANTFLDLTRRRARLSSQPLEDVAVTSSVDSGFDADVELALRELPEKFRTVVVLCHIDGLTCDEAAAALGIPVSTVRTRLHRGRARLRTALAHRAPREHV